jgi:hypothetical protein
MQDVFLVYLQNWKEYAFSKEGIPLEINKTMLSMQTLEGLKITGMKFHSQNIVFIQFVVHSFIEIVPFLLSMDGAKFLLSERFNQDNVEIFFAKQRARCGRGDNPTVNQFIYNTQAIRTSRSMSKVTSSNIRKRKLFHDIDDLSQPLRKRSRNNNDDDK